MSLTMECKELNSVLAELCLGPVMSLARASALTLVVELVAQAGQTTAEALCTVVDGRAGVVVVIGLVVGRRLRRFFAQGGLA